MSNGKAFLTGFLNGLGDGIASRKDEAKEYLEEQSSRARKIADTQLTERRTLERQLRQTALTLHKTANMPEHVVRGLIESGPESINAAMELYRELPRHEWTATDWEDIYETSEFYAREYNEDLNTFIRRTVGLIGPNYRAQEQAGGGDVNSAFMASALGLNAMDRARGALGEKEAGGYTYEQLLAMGDRPLYSTNPESTYAGQDLTDVGRLRSQYAPPASDSEVRQWYGIFSGEVETEAAALTNAYRRQYGEEPDPRKVRQMAEQQVLTRIAPLMPQGLAERFVKPTVPSNAPQGTPEALPAPQVTDTPETGDGAPTPSAEPSVVVPEQYRPAADMGVDPIGIPQAPDRQGTTSPAMERLRGVVNSLRQLVGGGGGVSDRRSTPAEEGPSAQGVDTSAVREAVGSFGNTVKRALTGGGGSSDNMLPSSNTPPGILKGVDPATQSYIYQDPATREEFRVPINR